MPLFQKRYVPTHRVIKAATRDVLDGRRRAPWHDGRTPDEFRVEGDPLKVGRIVRTHLRDGTHEWKRARRGRIYRLDKEPRLHAIVNVHDDIALHAMHRDLRPLWDRLPAYIRGGRPGQSVWNIVAKINDKLQQGQKTVLRFEVQNAFCAVDADRAVDDLLRATGRPDIAHAIQEFLDAQRPAFSGVVEGCCVAQLMFAVTMASHVMPFVVPYAEMQVLFADDGLLIEKDAGLITKALQILEERLDSIGLPLHPGKTQVHTYMPGTYSEFDSLGFAFGPRGPIPGHEKRQQLEEILHFIHDVEEDEEQAKWFIRKSVTNFRDHFAVVPDPILTVIDDQLSKEFSDYHLPKIAQCSALRRASNQRLDCDDGEYPNDETWQEPSLRRYLQRKFRERWEKQSLETSSLGVSASSQSQSSLAGGAVKRGLGNPRSKGRAGRGGIWLPPGSPTLREFDLYPPSYRKPEPLPDGFLPAFANLSGENYLEVGNLLAWLRASLDEHQFHHRCARLGIHYSETTRLIAAANLMDIRLREMPKPPAFVLDGIGEAFLDGQDVVGVAEEMVRVWGAKRGGGRLVLDVLSR